MGSATHTPSRRGFGNAAIYIALACVVATTGMKAPAAPNTEDLQKMVMVARHWLTRQLPRQPGATRIISIQQPDPRLALHRCNKLQFRLSEGNVVPTGRLPLLVRCQSPRWQLYLVARITVMVPAVVSTRSLSTGTVLRPSDYVRASRPEQDLPPGAVTSAKQVAGHILLRNVAAGIPLSAPMIGLPRCIRQGEHVTIVASGEHLKLSVAGVAMQSGRAGQLILVRNATSGRVIRARVTGPGRVRVSF